MARVILTTLKVPLQYSLHTHYILKVKLFRDCFIH